MAIVRFIVIGGLWIRVLRELLCAALARQVYNMQLGEELVHNNNRLRAN